mgnify:CR=1 FL=1
MAESFKLTELNIPETSEYHRLLERCPDISPVRFGEGEYLTQAGDASKEIFLVLRGSYVVDLPDDRPGKRSARALATVTTCDEASPSFVGEMAYLGGGLRTASVRSSGTTYALCLQPRHLDVLIEEFPLLTRALCKQFTDRLRQTTDALKENEALFTMETTQLTKEAGEILFRKGEPADTLYQLLGGVLARECEGEVQTLTAQQCFLGFVEPLPYLRDAVHVATVKAETHALVVTIPKQSRLALIRNVPELALRCLREALSG